MTKWINGKIIKIKHWTKNLFTLKINASIDPFIPGQFAKLGLKINNKLIQRAYSYINTPDNKNLEFYLTNIPDGKLSPLLHSLQPGDNIMITKKAYGNFIIKNIPNCNILWMLATGTGIAPYISILSSKTELKRFNTIVLIYAIRFFEDLNYLQHMLKFKEYYKNKIKIQIIFSQDIIPNTLTGRIPTLIENGLLEKTIGIKFNSKNCHIMICGNPKMICDVQKILKQKKGIQNPPNKDNFKQITKERYW